MGFNVFAWQPKRKAIVEGASRMYIVRSIRDSVTMTKIWLEEQNAEGRRAYVSNKCECEDK